MDIIGTVIDVAQAKYDEPVEKMRVVVESAIRAAKEPAEDASGVLTSVAILYSNGEPYVKASGGSPDEAIKALGKKVLAQGDASVASLKEKLEILRGLVGG
jgi:hypothetical protein